MASPVYAAAPTRAFNYVAHTTIDPAQNNSNENALYSYLQAGVDTYSSGSITNDAISGSAAISASKLNLIGITQNMTNTGTFTNTGDFTIVGTLSVSGTGNSISGGLGATPIGAIIPSTGKFTTLEATTTFKLGTTHQGDILYDNGTSLIRLVPGTSGQFLKTQGASANPVWASTSSVPTNIQVFTSNGTWTKPAGISSVYVKVVGSGGGGGTVGTTNTGGGGGGAGGYAEGLIAVTGDVTVLVPAGGTTSTAGGTSSFAGSTTIQATGGSGGGNASGTTPGVGGAGGVGSVGTLNFTGGTGAYGSGGAGGNSAAGGTVGVAPGSGGGGASGGGTGAAGASGVVIVMY